MQLDELEIEDADLRRFYARTDEQVKKKDFAGDPCILSRPVGKKDTSSKTDGSFQDIFMQALSTDRPQIAAKGPDLKSSITDHRAAELIERDLVSRRANTPDPRNVSAAMSNSTTTDANPMDGNRPDTKLDAPSTNYAKPKNM